MSIKHEPTMGPESQGIVVWCYDGEVAVDVATGLFGMNVGCRISPARARELAADLTELADAVELAAAVDAATKVGPS